MPEREKSCAFFDLDGTLLRGFIIQAFPRFLADSGFIEPRYPDEIAEVGSRYSSGRISYREAAEIVPEKYASAVRGKNLDDVKRYASRFMATYVPEHAFPYSIPLINEMRTLFDLTVVLSGNPHHVIAELKPLGFDKIYGSIFELNNGEYSGEVSTNLILGEEKARLVRKISRELSLDLSKSIAFGDSDQDAPMLSLVGIPVAVNPNEKMKEICEMKGWRWFTTEDLKDFDSLKSWINKKKNYTNR